MTTQINNHSRNLQCNLAILIRQHYIRLSLIFSMEHFCKINTSQFVWKKISKNSQTFGRGDPFPSKGLSKNKTLLVKVRYESKFVLCLRLITIPSTIQYNVFSNFSEKLIFLSITYVCELGANVNFSENFANVLNEWSHLNHKTLNFLLRNQLFRSLLKPLKKQISD